MGAFVDRAAEAHRVEKSPAHALRDVRRSLAGDPSRLTSILRCLARSA